MSQSCLSYNKLWKLLIDKRMTKGALSEKSNVSKATLAKMKKGESVTLETISRICFALNCNIGDVVELKK